ncbi:hypothetical protein Pint_24916 [Pistacia integerrima]|uniref:Uncharacterized protein n=1 Tax=Pistacia integerrima TaxID=434235 RepID=A0ACC0YBU8_9ROSI|nr:hypothetical protein Pint_24916 [Pistacia integerrima]
MATMFKGFPGTTNSLLHYMEVHSHSSSLGRAMRLERTELCKFNMLAQSTIVHVFREYCKNFCKLRTFLISLL